MTAERPESDFCNRVQQELGRCLGLSLFDISYQFNEDDVIHTKRIKDDDNIKLLFDETKRNHIFDKPFRVDWYDFALNEDALYCTLWDREQKILMIYSLKGIYGFDLKTRFVCKGFRVQNTRVYNPTYTIFRPRYVDYWGGNTKDILNVSRSSFLHKQLRENKTIFENATVCLTKIYHEVLKNLIKSDELKELCIINDSDDIFNTSLMTVIHLMLWVGINILPLETGVRKALSTFSGYDGSYGFEDKKNVGDIIFSDELKIPYDYYKSICLYEFSFFFKGRKINKITVNSEKEVQIIYGKEYNKRDTVEYVRDSFALFLNYHDDTVPVPLKFEDIAVKNTANSNDVFGFAKTYMTDLWDKFDGIKETYAERIKNGEEIEKMADEIVPVSRTDKKPATNVLRNICYDRAFNRELPYDEAWHKVRDTYRKFVIKVLNAVKWLSENGYIEPTDDNNEEMEEQ